MGVEGLVFGFVAAFWLIYLIPLFLNRRDNGLMDEVEPGDPFTGTVTIVRRGTPLDSAEDANAVVSTPLNRRAALRELAAIDAGAARRRRRVLTFLVLATLTVVAFAAFGLTAWWGVLVPVALVVAFLGVARFSVRAMRRDLDRRARIIRGADAEEDTIALVLTDEAPDADDASVELSVPVESTGSLWDPVPITAPTYVSRPLAPRTVRTIDLSMPAPTTAALPVTADLPSDAPAEDTREEADLRRAVGE
ncbi:hypothetical protein [Propioniciclava soli]|uniref:hypothetical protein n=1 Tax=Propioniciclava soli TaxID=2775081 RepID=UPI001E3615C7|nr:hypothetical protein [Propioniciclava soli]